MCYIQCKWFILTRLDLHSPACKPCGAVNTSSPKNLFRQLRSREVVDSSRHHLVAVTENAGVREACCCHGYSHSVLWRRSLTKSNCKGSCEASGTTYSTDEIVQPLLSKAYLGVYLNKQQVEFLTRPSLHVKHKCDFIIKCI